MTVIHIFGDSHIFIISTIKNYTIIKHPYIACSGMGLYNKHSLTKYRNALIKDFAQIKFDDIVIFKFGQIDVDFVYYLKLANNDKKLLFRDFAENSVNKYFSFILEILNLKNVNRNNFYIMSTFPPVVNNNNLINSLQRLHFMDDSFKITYRNNLQQVELPSLKYRTTYSHVYNILLLYCAVMNGINFIDVFNPFINSDGVCKWINDDYNYHLTEQHVALLTEILNNITYF